MPLLSASELSSCLRRSQEQLLPTRGIKHFQPSNSWLEEKQVASALEERKSLLAADRIEKWSMRSVANWIPDKNVAEVTRKVGKQWQSVGNEKGGKLVLQPEEALYLLETNDLELLYGNVAMSVQQAYSLLLGAPCSLAEYRTYCKLQRLGLHVMRHRAISPTPEQPPATTATYSGGTKRPHEPDKQEPAAKRRSTGNVNSPAEKQVETKIELIDLEDEEPSVFDLLPNIAGKDYVCIKVPPANLLPENVQPRCSQYFMKPASLKEPGRGARPLPPTRQPTYLYPGLPWLVNRPTLNQTQNILQLLQRYPTTMNIQQQQLQQRQYQQQTQLQILQRQYQRQTQQPQQGQFYQQQQNQHRQYQQQQTQYQQRQFQQKTQQPQQQQYQQQRFLPRNNVFNTTPQQFMRPFVNINAQVNMNFPFLPRMSSTWNANFFGNSPNRFFNFGRTFLQQTANRTSTLPPPLVRGLPVKYQQPQLTITEQQTSSSSSEEQTHPPQAAAPRLKAKSWAEVKAKLSTTVETITLDDEDESFSNAVLDKVLADNTSLLQPDDCRSLDSVWKKLQILPQLQAKVSCSELDIKFDAYKPSNSFRKSEANTPAYYVVVVSHPDSVLSDADLAGTEDGVPVLYSIVQSDTVNFFTLASVDLDLTLCSAE